MYVFIIIFIIYYQITYVHPGCKAKEAAEAVYKLATKLSKETTKLTKLTKQEKQKAMQLKEQNKKYTVRIRAPLSHEKYTVIGGKKRTGRKTRKGRK